jgi:hypothetical protein
MHGFRYGQNVVENLRPLLLSPSSSASLQTQDAAEEIRQRLASVAESEADLAGRIEDHAKAQAVLIRDQGEHGHSYLK